MVGATEKAYRLLLETGCPSWLYAVVQGATTVWERWDALLPDGSVNPGRMTSFNHYALGSLPTGCTVWWQAWRRRARVTERFRSDHAPAVG